MTTPAPLRELVRLHEPGHPGLVLQSQTPRAGAPDVLYVHGATFGADLSLFHRLGGRSWADAIEAAGMAAWGFDFAGYGRSDRYPDGEGLPTGRIDAALAQLQRAVAAVQQRNGKCPVALVAHSWGATVAMRFAGSHPDVVKALVLFGPVAKRAPAAEPPPATAQPSHHLLTQWAQYRRFVQDVPRGQAQVLDEAHYEAWAADFLASDPASHTRSPPAVRTPYGPVADATALWSGQDAYDPSRVTSPVLLIRGEWDSVCTDLDAAGLLARLGSTDKCDAKVERAGHLMHLESQRTVLHDKVNAFLERCMT